MSLRVFQESTSALRQLRSEFKPAHATYVQIEAYAEGRLEDPVAKQHLKDCVQCRAEAEDLRKFVVETNIQRRPLFQGRWWWIAAPAVAAAMAWLAFTGWRGSPSKSAIATAQHTAPATGLPAELATLKDDALRTGSVGIPAEVRSLAGTPNVLLGRSPTPVSVALTSPVSTATLSDRPLFRWNPIAGAAWYRVGIFDSHFVQVADSGKLTTATWTPERPLLPGQAYAWQLSALVKGRTITAPRPPAPQAPLHGIASGGNRAAARPRSNGLERPGAGWNFVRPRRRSRRGRQRVAEGLGAGSYRGGKTVARTGYRRSIP